MTNLKKLKISGTSIEQYNLDHLDLVDLRINNSGSINNLSFMKNLKVLHADNYSVNQNVIASLDLFELSANDNEDIYDVSFIIRLLNSIAMQ